MPGPVTLKFPSLSLMAAKMAASVSSIMFTFRVRTKKEERASTSCNCIIYWQNFSNYILLVQNCFICPLLSAGVANSREKGVGDNRWTSFGSQVIESTNFVGIFYFCFNFFFFLFSFLSENIVILQLLMYYSIAF